MNTDKTISVPICVHLCSSVVKDFDFARPLAPAKPDPAAKITHHPQPTTHHPPQSSIPSIISHVNTAPSRFTNSHKYSCRNTSSPLFARSSSRNRAEIRGQSGAPTLILSHPSPPRSHSSQKNPCFPSGVLISHKSPSPTASIGRTAR